MRVLPSRTYAANTRAEQRLLPHGIQHPAKMHPLLARDLFLRYTLPGQTVLDPFGGRGTSLLGITLGRHVLLNELEAPFVEYQRANLAHLQYDTLPGVPLGRAEIHQGDSRHLDWLATAPAADACLTSPPYADAVNQHPAADDLARRLERMAKAGVDTSKRVNVGGPNGGHRIRQAYTDAAITSPPYAEALTYQQAGAGGEHWELLRAGYTPAQIAEMRRADDPRVTQTRRDAGYSRDPSNIGNLPHAAITSPPFADLASRDREQEAYAQKHGEREREYGGSANRHVSGYGHSDGQIGNDRGEDYAAACLAVYRECGRVVRPGGVLVLVTGNYVRDGAIVDLAADTIALAVAAGWTPWERWEHRKAQVSFWRRLHHRQGRPVVTHEDVLVFVKGDAPAWEFADLPPTTRPPVTLGKSTPARAGRRAQPQLPLEGTAA